VIAFDFRLVLSKKLLPFETGCMFYDDVGSSQTAAIFEDTTGFARFVTQHNQATRNPLVIPNLSLKPTSAVDSQCP
jgi:hypothetical protein